MKKVAFSSCLLLYCITSFGQDEITKITDSIVTEAKRLYKSEMASWYGTDIFLEKYSNRDNIGGYLSYTHGDIATCIFFSKGNSPKVIGTISFDSTYNTISAGVDLDEREFTAKENDLYLIRTKALQVINGDTLFKRYKNTNLNLIPLIQGDERKVYVLTASEESNIVIFGNDYLIQFDNSNNITSKRSLHSNLLPAKYGEKDEKGDPVFGSMHTHAPTTGDFITATDVCTLLLYEKIAKWHSYIVASEHYVCIWNCESNRLVAITRDAFEKINEDQKKRYKNQ